MPVESASDLASMFDDDEFAETAEYLAPGSGGAATACLVIVDRGQGRETFAGGEQRLATSERHLWVQLAELAVVARDGTFTLTGADEVLKVTGLPKLDQTGRLWSVPLVLVS